MLQPVFLEASIVPLIIILFLLVAIMLYLGSRLKVVHEGTQIVIERWGQYFATWSSGLHFLYPFFDRPRKFYDFQGHITYIIDTREQELSYLSKVIFTKDNRGIQTDITMFLQISDAKKYIYAADKTEKLISSLVSKTFYNTIIEMDLNEVLEGRDRIIKKILPVMDEALESWGITLNHMEISNIVSQKDS
ncbi:SPFH domain-containing protein [Mycoplasmatota bacterium WC30]